MLALSKRYPGEGGVYLWARERFGGLHGFISGWCYWTNSLFYVPVLLVYLAGVLAFAGGDRTAGLVDNPWFVGGVAFGWLALITAANIRGMGVGKWINNIGGAGGMATVVLVAIAAAVARWTGTATTPVAGAGHRLRHGRRARRDVLRLHRHRARLDDVGRNPASGAGRAAIDRDHRRDRARRLSAGGRRADRARAAGRARRRFRA